MIRQATSIDSARIPDGGAVKSRWITRRSLADAFAAAKAVATTIAFAMCVVGASEAAICPTSASSFRVDSGQWAGDTSNDYLVSYRPTVLMLPLDDELFPLSIDHGLRRFLVYPKASYFVISSEIVTPTMGGGADVTSGFNVHLLGSSSATECSTALFQGKATSYPTFLARFNPGTGNPDALQLLYASFGPSMSDPTSSLVFADRNGDGRADMVHLVSGVVSGAYVASASGTLEYDRNATIAAAWDYFAQAASRGETSLATLYLTAVANEKYSAVMQDPAALQALVAGVVRAGVVSSSDRFASFAVFVGDPADPQVFFVNFLFVDGQWRINDF